MIHTRADLNAALDRITFAPSCLDMGWRLLVTNNGAGWFIAASFQRPDTQTGTLSWGYGRAWFVHHGCSEDSAIKTAWLAVQQVVTHELMEAFLVDGVRVFNPHAQIGDLIDLHRE